MRLCGKKWNVGELFHWRQNVFNSRINKTTCVCVIKNTWSQLLSWRLIAQNAKGHCIFGAHRNSNQQLCSRLTTSETAKCVKSNCPAFQRLAETKRDLKIRFCRFGLCSLFSVRNYKIVFFSLFENSEIIVSSNLTLRLVEFLGNRSLGRRAKPAFMSSASAIRKGNALLCSFSSSPKARKSSGGRERKIPAWLAWSHSPHIKTEIYFLIYAILKYARYTCQAVSVSVIVQLAHSW